MRVTSGSVGCFEVVEVPTQISIGTVPEREQPLLALHDWCDLEDLKIGF